MNLIPEEIEMELRQIYIDPSPLIALWNRSQVREPYDFGEVEDLFFEVGP